MGNAMAAYLFKNMFEVKIDIVVQSTRLNMV